MRIDCAVTATPSCTCALRFNMQTDGGIEIRLLRRADFPDGIPILAPRFGFARLEKTEVGLVVGINAGHDFDVGAEFAARIGIGQVAIPGITKLVIAPGPLFFAGRNMMVGEMDDARLRLDNRSRQRNPPGCPCTYRTWAQECWRRTTDRSARNPAVCDWSIADFGVLNGNAAARIASGFHSAELPCARVRRSSRRNKIPAPGGYSLIERRAWSAT